MRLFFCCATNYSSNVCRGRDKQMETHRPNEAEDREGRSRSVCFHFCSTELVPGPTAFINYKLMSYFQWLYRVCLLFLLRLVPFCERCNYFRRHFSWHSRRWAHSDFAFVWWFALCLKWFIRSISFEDIHWGGAKLFLYHATKLQEKKRNWGAEKAPLVVFLVETQKGNEIKIYLFGGTMERRFLPPWSIMHGSLKWYVSRLDTRQTPISM